MKKLTLFSLCLFSFLLGSSQFLTKMQQVANVPMPVSNNAVVEGWGNDTGYVYSFGGIDSTKIWSGITKKAFRYNTITDIWDTIPDLPNTNAVIASAASYVDSIIYIMGGYQVLSNGNEISSNIVNRYDPRTNTYLSDGANIPVATDDHVQGVWNDSLIYVITGWSNTANIPNVQIYDPANDNWAVGSAVPNNNLYKAFGASGTIIGNTIYYHGGAISTGNFSGQSTLRIGQIDPNNPTQITWSTDLTSTEITYRSIPALFQLSSDFLVWLGGSNVTYNFNGVAYNGSGGVEPRNEPLYYNTSLNLFENSIQFNPQVTLPMDLRGLANFPSFTPFPVTYIAGGMESTQTVSKKTYKVWMELITGIEDKNKSKPFQLYPNPTSQQINLEFKKVETRTINLIDILGNLVFQTKISATNFQLDIVNYPKGIYFVQVKTDKYINSQKIVIE